MIDAPSSAVRIRVMKRDRFQCTYCGVPGTDAELEVDHIIAVANGGSHHMSNLTTACRACNQEKGARKSFTQMQKVTAASKPISIHPLVGMWFHSFKDESVHWQGQIICVDDGIALCQLYDWLMGQPTHVEAVDQARLYTDEFRLYSSDDDMREWYRKLQSPLRRKGHWQ